MNLPEHSDTPALWHFLLGGGEGASGISDPATGWDLHVVQEAEGRLTYLLSVEGSREDPRDQDWRLVGGSQKYLPLPQGLRVTVSSLR